MFEPRIKVVFKKTGAFGASVCMARAAVYTHVARFFSRIKDSLKNYCFTALAN